MREIKLQPERESIRFRISTWKRREEHHREVRNDEERDI